MRSTNSCHWVLYTAIREDPNLTYIGHAAKSLGTLRTIVLNLLKIALSDTRSVPKKRRRAMLELNYRDSLLSLARSPCSHVRNLSLVEDRVFP